MRWGGRTLCLLLYVFLRLTVKDRWRSASLFRGLPVTYVQLGSDRLDIVTQHALARDLGDLARLAEDLRTNSQKPIFLDVRPV